MSVSLEGDLGVPALEDRRQDGRQQERKPMCLLSGVPDAAGPQAPGTWLGDNGVPGGGVIIGSKLVTSYVSGRSV